MRVAAIDVGSNSVLLTVLERTPNGWKAIYEKSTVTALGRGTKLTGLLTEQAMLETLVALQDGYRIANELNAHPVFAAGTMALRIARNSAEFVEKCASQNTPVVILEAKDEARLGFQAVAYDATFCDCGVLSMVDPGGHSTEFVTAMSLPEGWSTQLQRSVPVGAIGLLDGLESPDRPSPADRMNLVNQIDELIGLQYLPLRAGTVVVLGATGTNLVSIRDHHKTWQPELVHGATLSYEEVGRAAGWLMDKTGSERAQLVGLEPGREHTIHLGTLILERFLIAFGVESCRVSVRGWRHAMVEELLTAPEAVRTP